MKKALALLRISTVAASIGAILVFAAVAGAAYDFADSRNEMWSHAAAATGGDPHRGEAMFIQYGCGSCHGLKHVRKASGTVGPPLDGIAVRAIIAGKLNNTPSHLQAWIRDPQRISPGTAMPDLQVGDRDARDISAFLYTRAE
jgi:cytochrome c2